MRRILAVMGVVALTACSDPVAVPDADVQATLEEMASLAYLAAGIAEGGAAGGGILPRLGSLPPALALTTEQSSEIRALFEAFLAATAADREQLAAIRREAAEARQAGRPAQEVRAILARGEDARRRLAEAEASLHRSVLAVLTPAQRAWLAGHRPPEPRTCALTDAQRTEISALVAAYQQDNAADLALVRAAHEQARAAHAAGAPRDQVAAILAEARPALERLRAARETLQQEIQAVLTPQQRAAGCLR